MRNKDRPRARVAGEPGAPALHLEPTTGEKEAAALAKQPTSLLNRNSEKKENKFARDISPTAA